CHDLTSGTRGSPCVHWEGDGAPTCPVPHRRPGRRTMALYGVVPAGLRNGTRSGSRRLRSAIWSCPGDGHDLAKLLAAGERKVPIPPCGLEVPGVRESEGG